MPSPKKQVRKKTIKSSAKLLKSKKMAVKKAVVKKLVKRVVAKAAAKKSVSKKKSLKSSLVIAPQERMITLADLFREEQEGQERVGVAQIVSESFQEMKSENQDLKLEDLFEEVSVVPASAPAQPEMVTLADLFENFDWDKVVQEVSKAEVSPEPAVMAERTEEPQTTPMFHSISTPRFSSAPKKSPSLLARLFHPQMVATMGITLVSLFFVSMWFKATKASFDEGVNIQAWEQVKDGYRAIQKDNQGWEKINSEKSSTLDAAQDAINKFFGQAIERNFQQK